MKLHERQPAHVYRQPRWGVIFAMLAMLAQPVLAQQEGGITPNYKQADIRQIIEAVSAVTGKTFVVDPRVKAEVTMLSSEPMTPDAFYATFLSILEVYGFVAVENAGLTKILPNANVRSMPTSSRLSGAAPDDIVTRVIEVRNVGAAQLVPVLRPLVPQYGHLAAHAQSNMLIISDRASNVQRMMSIIRRIDQAGDEEIEVVPLLHASAGEIVRIMQSLSGAQRTDGTPATINLVADERTNSVLIGGEKSSRLRLRALIAHLDTPLEDGGNMQVRYLHYASAVDLAEKLQSQFQAQAQPQGQAAAGPANSTFNIWADEQTNALIITAPPKVMRSIMNVVDKIDIRRAQVVVEAIIVEVSEDSTLDLGVSWAAFDDEGNTPFAATDFPGDSNRRTLSGVAAGAAAEGAAQFAGAIGPGATFGLGRVVDNGVSFAAIVSAFAGDGDSNIISTPTIVTMDNEEARIEVGQEVPFLSGSFANTGGNNGAVNPFQTINREKVGTLLEITPQINEGNAILLKIKQETSSVAPSSQGAADLITNERIIETSVIVDDGGILVLGGLIDDSYQESEQRVPILGRIPLLGSLFRAKNTIKEKTNLMVFIRPRILRDGTQSTIETNQKYNYIRNLQRGDEALGNGRGPVLPELSSYPTTPEPIDLRGDSADADGAQDTATGVEQE